MPERSPAPVVVHAGPARPTARVRLAVFAVGATLAIVFVFLVPAGLPYDEPSHWQNVTFYASHHTMPVIGDRGVSYEAQMGPVAYVVDAVLTLGFGGASRAAFYGVRLLGAIELLVFAGLIGAVVRRSLPAEENAAVFATACVLFNPMLLTMAASVQNDILALCLATGALLAMTGASVGRATSALSGCLVGLALITKLIVWPIGLVLGVSLVLRRKWLEAFIFVSTATLVSGWWFVRNEYLYGDLTGRRGVIDAGYHFPPLGHIDPIGLVRSVMTYLWLPTEYVRNVVDAPGWVDLLVVALSLAGAFGVVRVVVRLWPGRSVVTLVAIAVLAVATWLVTAIATQAVAFRFAYAALPLWFLGLGGLVLLRGGRAIAVLVLVAELCVSGWFLLSVSDLSPLLTRFTPDGRP